MPDLGSLPSEIIRPRDAGRGSAVQASVEPETVLPPPASFLMAVAPPSLVELAGEAILSWLCRTREAKWVLFSKMRGCGNQRDWR